MPAAQPANRLALLGCALAAVAALALSACGDGGPATAENAATSPERQSNSAASRPCPAKLDAFDDSLARLRRQLAVGLSYDQYAARIEHLRSAYDAIPIDRLTLGCLAVTGTPAERALNEYIDAANAWGECLADVACDTATIEPVLQRKWRVASHYLSEVG